MPTASIRALADAVVPLDGTAQAAAAERQSRLTKPSGALGRVEDLSVWLAGVQRRCPPTAPARRGVVVFAGDHGVAAQGVSAYPPEVTAQMVRNLVAGGAAANVLARRVGATVRVLDIAVDADLGDLPADVTAYKVRRSSGRIDQEPALSAGEAARALDAGARALADEVAAGAAVVIAGDMGIGNSTVAAAVTCAVTGADPAAVVGRGTGVDDTAWRRKVGVVDDALARAGVDAGDGLALLIELGGADLAAMTGFMLAAAASRTPVLLDGVVSGAAALVAAAICPGATAYFAAGHRSTEPAHALALARLGLTPLLDLGLRLGEGTGALLALPLLDAAVDVLSEMATFDSAGVSDRTVR